MPLKVTVEKMVDAISASEQPALTKQDIADALDVSWQSIDNHEEELVEDVRVESGKIGKATVYWLAEPTGGGARGSGGPDSAGGRPADVPPGDRDEVVSTSDAPPPREDSSDELEPRDISQTTSSVGMVDRFAELRVGGYGVLFLVASVAAFTLFVFGLSSPAVLPPLTLPLLAGIGGVCFITGAFLIPAFVIARLARGQPIRGMFGDRLAEEEA